MCEPIIAHTRAVQYEQILHPVLKSKRTSFCFPGLVPKYKALLDLERQPNQEETIRNLQAETYMLARQSARNPESRNTELIQSHQQTIQALRQDQNERELQRQGLASFITQSGPFVPVNVVNKFGLHQRTMTYPQRMQELVPEPEDRNAFAARGTVANGNDSDDAETVYEDPEDQEEKESYPRSREALNALTSVGASAVSTLGPPLMRTAGNAMEGLGQAMSAGLPPLAQGLGTGLGMAATGLGYGLAHVGAAGGRYVAHSIYDAALGTALPNDDDIAPHALPPPRQVLALPAPSDMFQSPFVPSSRPSRTRRPPERLIESI